MDQFQKTREEIISVNEKTLNLLIQAETILGRTASSFDQWKQICANINQNLMDHVVRIAVVGAIKSGKSTLVNALLQDDYLKRGAGVVTSIVTRIRQGTKLQARLYFKSWDEVNTEIEQALVLFPSDEWLNQDRNFDIRRSKDRMALADALNALDAGLRVAQDGLNANGVLLSSYLKGYDRVEAYVGPEGTTAEFDQKRFGEHRTFVGDDTLAVYLKDIQLSITDGDLGSNIEIADCQGSDSPNPLHMAMIQDYLLKAHLIIYVISSRTGLRQADIRFLSIIKQMGISDNILFVCNCDINEHESLSDLQALVQKINDELALMLPKSQMFVFSALYHLFKDRMVDLPPRDKAQLTQWEKAVDLAKLSADEILRLKRELTRKLTRERSALLLQNQLERLDIISSGLHHWVELSRDLLRRDAKDVHSMTERVLSHQGYIQQVQSMVRSTLDGGMQTISAELKNKVDSFFDQHSGPLLQIVLGFVRNYLIDLNRYREYLNNSGFTQALYLVFQDFKQAVDTQMAEKINPEIMRFISRLEFRLKDHFNKVAEPYEAMVRDATEQYQQALGQFDLTRIPGQWAFNTTPDLDGIKQAEGLSLPPAAATMRYSANVKTEAILRLGFYSLVRVVRKLLKKQSEDKNAEELEALKYSIRRMKRETERSIIAHFRDYQENIKFQYILRLVDAARSRLFEGLTEHFSTYLADLQELITTMGGKRNDKQIVEAELGSIQLTLENLHGQIEKMRQDLSRFRSGGDIADAKKAANA